MAGRGTDIRLDEAATAAGGLHVVATMRNRARRIDRQLTGRAARHGDPGSAELLLALDDSLLQRTLPAPLLAAAQRLARWLPAGASTPSSAPPGTKPVHPALAAAVFFIAQRVAEWRDRNHRRELRHADLEASQTFGFSGGTE